MSLDAALAESTAAVNEAYGRLRAQCPPELLDVLEALHEHHLALIQGIGDMPRLAREALAAALKDSTEPLAEVTALDRWKRGT